MNLEDKHIDELIELRKEAREKKDWKLSDEIRNYLDAKLVFIFDTKDGQEVYNLTEKYFKKEEMQSRIKTIENEIAILTKIKEKVVSISKLNSRQYVEYRIQENIKSEKNFDAWLYSVKQNLQEDPGCGRKNLSRQERIEIRKKEIGSKHNRKLLKYSENFNRIFNFFLNSCRKELLSFSGSEDFKVEFDKDGPDGRFCYRLYEDGDFKNEDPNKPTVIKTRHPNVVYSVIKGKKCWGLWVAEWSMGIAECNFTKEEILNEFTSRGIEIPESFIIELDKLVERYKVKRYERDSKPNRSIR